jgi:DNA repair exonuclease SbcCD nuclease subunit
MKMLWVGDPHATVRELEDVGELVNLACSVALQEDVDVIHIAGDLYDNFSLVNTQVMEFWKRSFKALQNRAPVEVLKGNHDMSNDSTSSSHALMAHPEVRVFDRPILDAKDRILYMPFIRNPEEFVAEALKYVGKADLVFCHQDFSGAKYENGFFSKEGVEPSLLPFKQIVSGHIHAPFRFGNVWYPGAPRWRTLSDAAESDRFIYIFEIEGGQIVETRQYSTKEVCRRIMEIQLTPEKTEGIDNLKLSNKCDYRVSISGPEDFVRAMEIRVNVEIPGAKVAAVIFDESVKLRESEGISASFQKWFEAFNPPFGTDKDRLRAMVKERVHV